MALLENAGSEVAGEKGVFWGSEGSLVEFNEEQLLGKRAEN